MTDLRLLSTRRDLLVQTGHQGSVHVVTLSGDADRQSQGRLSSALRAGVPDDSSALVLDLRGLAFCSPQAMGALVDAVASLADRGLTVAVVGLPLATARVWLMSEVPVPMQYGTVEQAVAAMAVDHGDEPTAGVDAESGTANLLAEVEGLRRALATRAVIEQAKGMLMERLSCTAEEAFDLIVLQSQNSSRKLHEVATEYLRANVGTSAIASSSLFRERPGRRAEAPVDPEPAA
jgi:anti-anti-sigma factor